MEQQESIENTAFDFENLLPNLTKLMTWLQYASAIGMLIFPFLALTLEPQFAIHFWILTCINGGLLVTLIVFGGQISKLDQPQTKQDQQSIPQDNNNKQKSKKKSNSNNKQK